MRAKSTSLLMALGLAVPFALSVHQTATADVDWYYEGYYDGGDYTDDWYYDSYANGYGLATDYDYDYGWDAWDYDYYDGFYDDDYGDDWYYDAYDPVW